MVDDDLMHTAAVMAPRHAALCGSLSLLPVRQLPMTELALRMGAPTASAAAAAAMRTATTDDAYALYEHMPQ